MGAEYPLNDEHQQASFEEEHYHWDQVEDKEKCEETMNDEAYLDTEALSSSNNKEPMNLTLEEVPHISGV